jgi:hypothetical protein
MKKARLFTGPIYCLEALSPQKHSACKHLRFYAEVNGASHFGKRILSAFVAAARSPRLPARIRAAESLPLR